MCFNVNICEIIDDQFQIPFLYIFGEWTTIAVQVTGFTDTYCNILVSK